jgi:hypothetical protein
METAINTRAAAFPRFTDPSGAAAHEAAYSRPSVDWTATSQLEFSMLGGMGGNLMGEDLAGIAGGSSMDDGGSMYDASYSLSGSFLPYDGSDH